MTNLLRLVSRIKLSGSPEQVKWATAIRKKKCEELQKMKNQEIALCLKTHISDSNLESIHVDTPRKAVQLLIGVCVHSLSATDSKWWIANRDEKPHARLPGSWQKCFEYWKKTQPFK